MYPGLGGSWDLNLKLFSHYCILNRVAVRADLERSLKTRLLMHSESLLGAEDEEQEDKVTICRSPD